MFVFILFFVGPKSPNLGPNLTFFCRPVAAPNRGPHPPPGRPTFRPNKAMSSVHPAASLFSREKTHQKPNLVLLFGPRQRDLVVVFILQLHRPNLPDPCLHGVRIGQLPTCILPRSQVFPPCAPAGVSFLSRVGGPCHEEQLPMQMAKTSPIIA